MATANVYDIGDEVVLRADFKNRAGAPTNPTTVACKVRKPDGSFVNPAPAPISTGIYEATFDPDKPGEYWYRFDGTGAVKASGENKFVVRERRVA